MQEKMRVFGSMGALAQASSRPGEPCLLVIFGASGDLTKRLLMPALYNLACENLLPEKFAIVGIAMDPLDTDIFRERMTKDIRTFSTRPTFDEGVWNDFVQNLYYTPGKFDDPQAYSKLAELTSQLEAKYGTGGNIIFYLAVPPVVFGMISTHLDQAGFHGRSGWKRIIVEKPFGNDLNSAIELNRMILQHWREEQIYRIDHYLGKETVQNILAFRFSNGIFEPLWNKHYIDHIQFTVAEGVGVEGRGNYYERSGVLRDMIQNHMFQMLAYLCMEPPRNFQADSVRDEKSKVLAAIRVLKPEDVAEHTVRGQYGPGKKFDGTPAVGYRQEPDVNPESRTETYAAYKMFIDNWRWEGVPVYLRSGKALWKKGTEIIVQFKKAPEVLFKGTPIDHLEGNRLVFHIQPDQGIEMQFQAKIPGPSLNLQKVNMRFNYGEAFKAVRGTGYEALVYQCMIGDATLFSRTDLVEIAWRVAQPLLDHWSNPSTPADFPNYPVGSWGPKAAFDLIERDGRKWVEVINRDVLGRIPLFQGSDPLFLHALLMALHPEVAAPGELIIRKGDMGREMYIICRGQVEVLDDHGKVLTTLGDGDVFGEIGLLLAKPRTASIRALTNCDLFVLDQDDFLRVLKDHPQFAQTITEVARSRYDATVHAENLLEGKT